MKLLQLVAFDWNVGDVFITVTDVAPTDSDHFVFSFSDSTVKQKQNQQNYLFLWHFMVANISQQK